MFCQARKTAMLPVFDERKAGAGYVMSKSSTPCWKMQKESYFALTRGERSAILLNRNKENVRYERFSVDKRSTKSFIDSGCTTMCICMPLQWEILGIQDWTNLICLSNGVWERVAKIRIIKTKYFVLIDTHNRNVSNSCAYTLEQNMVGANGLEPLTPCTSSRCSSQLS